MMPAWMDAIPVAVYHASMAPHVDPLMLAAARVSTFLGTQGISNASGFFFERDDRLYLVTSRHVLIDEATQHFPDRVEIELHLDARQLYRSTGFSMLLYERGKSVWHAGRDSAGHIDVAVLRLEREHLPPDVAIRAFTPQHLQLRFEDVGVGESLLVAGFPLGFHDAVYHLPVVGPPV